MEEWRDEMEKKGETGSLCPGQAVFCHLRCLVRILLMWSRRHWLTPIFPHQQQSISRRFPHPLLAAPGSSLSTAGHLSAAHQAQSEAQANEARAQTEEAQVAAQRFNPFLKSLIAGTGDYSEGSVEQTLGEIDEKLVQHARNREQNSGAELQGREHDAVEGMQNQQGQQSEEEGVWRLGQSFWMKLKRGFSTLMGEADAESGQAGQMSGMSGQMELPQNSAAEQQQEQQHDLEAKSLQEAQRENGMAQSQQQQQQQEQQDDQQTHQASAEDDASIQARSPGQAGMQQMNHEQGIENTAGAENRQMESNSETIQAADGDQAQTQTQTQEGKQLEQDQQQQAQDQIEAQIEARSDSAQNREQNEGLAQANGEPEERDMQSAAADADTNAAGGEEMSETLQSWE